MSQRLTQIHYPVNVLQLVLKVRPFGLEAMIQRLQNHLNLLLGGLFEKLLMIHQGVIEWNVRVINAGISYNKTHFPTKILRPQCSKYLRRVEK